MKLWTYPFCVWTIKKRENGKKKLMIKSHRRKPILTWKKKLINFKRFDSLIENRNWRGANRLILFSQSWNKNAEEEEEVNEEEDIILMRDFWFDPITQDSVPFWCERRIFMMKDAGAVSPSCQRSEWWRRAEEAGPVRVPPSFENKIDWRRRGEWEERRAKGALKRSSTEAHNKVEAASSTRPLRWSSFCPCRVFASCKLQTSRHFCIPFRSVRVSVHSFLPGTLHLIAAFKATSNVNKDAGTWRRNIRSKTIFTLLLSGFAKLTGSGDSKRSPSSPAPTSMPTTQREDLWSSSIWISYIHLALIRSYVNCFNLNEIDCCRVLVLWLDSIVQPVFKFRSALKSSWKCRNKCHQLSGKLPQWLDPFEFNRFLTQSQPVCDAILQTSIIPFFSPLTVFYSEEEK